MICECLKVSDTDESVLDLNEILKVDLKSENIQPLNTRWDETMISIQLQPDEEMLENLFYRQLQHSERPKPLLSLIQDTVQKGASRDYTILTKMADRLLEDKISEKHFFSWKSTWKARFWRCSQGQVERQKKILEIACKDNKKVSALEGVSDGWNAIQRWS